MKNNNKKVREISLPTELHLSKPNRKARGQVRTKGRKVRKTSPNYGKKILFGRFPIKSELEEKLLKLLMEKLDKEYIEDMQTTYLFHVPSSPTEVHYLSSPGKKRKWEADFAFPSYSLLVEVQGGTFGKTRYGNAIGHRDGEQMDKDMEKLNRGQLMGWTILQFSSKMLDDEEYVLTLIKEGLGIA